MAKFRKKPIEIEAVPVHHLLGAAEHNWNALPSWAKDAYEKGQLIFLNTGIIVSTPEGKMEGGITDWIIKGIKGELYPCKDDIFRQTYDLVDETGKTYSLPQIDPISK